MSVAAAFASFAPALPLRHLRRASAPLRPVATRAAPPRRARFRPCASAADSSASTQSSSASTQSSPASSSLFRCPRCTSALRTQPPNQPSSLPRRCAVCNNAFARTADYVDLTVDASPSATDAFVPRPLRTLRDLLASPREQALFQLPVVSYAYERGWRDSFTRAGFPGIQRELDLLLDFAPSGDRILDLSCGTALMARRLAISNTYRQVIAADFSAAMLQEAAARKRADVMAPQFELIRVNVNALPFQHAVIDTVHAGAALHCWPCVQDALREIYRVLKPGGSLFATTFANGLDGVQSGTPRGADDGVRSVARRVQTALQARRVEAMGSVMYRFFERKELLFLAQAAGFVDVDVTLDSMFLLLRCRKPLK